VACGLEDPRISMYYDDGLRFLRGKNDEYDLIINDSTDPLGHTEGLFTKEFYGSCYKALREDGIMVYQHGSPFYDEDEAECRKIQVIPDQPGIPGTYPDLSFRILVIRIRF